MWDPYRKVKYFPSSYHDKNFRFLIYFMFLYHGRSKKISLDFSFRATLITDNPFKMLYLQILCEVTPMLKLNGCQTSFTDTSLILYETKYLQLIIMYFVYFILVSLLCMQIKSLFPFLSFVNAFGFRHLRWFFGIFSQGLDWVLNGDIHYHYVLLCPIFWPK